MSNNKIEALPARFLFNLHAVADLNLAQNKLADLNFIDAESQLKRLRAGSNRIAKIGKRVVCHELEMLDLSRNLLVSLGNLSAAFPNIEVLDVSHNDIVLMENLKSIANCERLVELSIAGNPLHYDGIQEVAKKRFSRIEVLDGVELCSETYTEQQIGEIESGLAGKMQESDMLEIRQKLHSFDLDHQNEEEEYTTQRGELDPQVLNNNDTLAEFYTQYGDEIGKRLAEIQLEVEATTPAGSKILPVKTEIKSEVYNAETISEIGADQQYAPQSIKSKPTAPCKSETNTALNADKPAQPGALFRIKQSGKTGSHLKKVLRGGFALKNPQLLRQQTEALRSQFKACNN